MPRGEKVCGVAAKGGVWLGGVWVLWCRSRCSVSISSTCDFFRVMVFVTLGLCGLGKSVSLGSGRCGAKRCRGGHLLASVVEGE